MSESAFRTILVYFHLLFRQLSIEEDEPKGEAANTEQSSDAGDNEEDDDIGKEFQDAVRQRGSVTVDRRKVNSNLVYLSRYLMTVYCFTGLKKTLAVAFDFLG